MFEALLISAIQSYGPLGLLMVMIIQTIIAPIPSEAVIMFSGAIGMDVLTVVIFGGFGLITGSVIAFYIARLGGRPIVKRFIGEEWVDDVDDWIIKNGARAILLTRLIPIVPFDLISYISGVTSLDFKKYLLATVIGAFPRCLMLAILGTTANRFLTFISVGLDLTILLGTIGFVVLIFLDRKGYIGGIKKFVMKRIMKKKF